MMANDIMAVKVSAEKDIFEGTDRKYESCKVSVYKLFWMFLFGGVAGFLIESVYCWFDFHAFTSRTSNLFFPISCVWGFGCVLVCVAMRRNRWNSPVYIFIKGSLLCAFFEFVCGWLGEAVYGVTFWDYTGMPLHIGRYVNVAFCVIWGLLSFLWINRLYPKLDQVTGFLAENRQEWSRGFLVFMAVTTMISGLALLRMEERQKSPAASNYIESVFDRAFPDKVMQWYFPKMKDAVTGEKIYRNW